MFKCGIEFVVRCDMDYVLACDIGAEYGQCWCVADYGMLCGGWVCNCMRCEWRVRKEE